MTPPAPFSMQITRSHTCAQRPASSTSPSPFPVSSQIHLSPLPRPLASLVRPLFPSPIYIPLPSHFFADHRHKLRVMDSVPLISRCGDYPPSRDAAQALCPVHLRLPPSPASCLCFSCRPTTASSPFSARSIPSKTRASTKMPVSK
jgi:hypothetical protein